MRRARMMLVPVLAAVAASSLLAQTVSGATPVVSLEISGPRAVHRGDNLWFTARLTNRSANTIAVPAPPSNIFWWYTVEAGWSITDKKGRRLKSTQADVVRFDNMIQMPTFKDSDFVFLAPGEKIEYDHHNLDDPSNLFFFPGNGFFDVSLAWRFCAPTVKTMPNNATAYTCGVTQALSQRVKDVLLATPSFDVRSNVWRIQLK